MCDRWLVCCPSSLTTQLEVATWEKEACITLTDRWLVSAPFQCKCIATYVVRTLRKHTCVASTQYIYVTSFSGASPVRNNQERANPSPSPDGPLSAWTRNSNTSIILLTLNWHVRIWAPCTPNTEQELLPIHSFQCVTSLEVYSLLRPQYIRVA